MEEKDWQPSISDIEWTRRTIDTLVEEGAWGIPSANVLLKVSKINKRYGISPIKDRSLNQNETDLLIRTVKTMKKLDYEIGAVEGGIAFHSGISVIFKVT